MWGNEIFDSNELIENSSFGNEDDYLNKFYNLNKSFYEPQPDFSQDNLFPYFHGKITEIDTGELNNVNVERKNNTNNTSKENSVDNPFVQTNINNEHEISKKENQQKNKNIEIADLTEQKLEENNSQEKKNENMHNNTNLNGINLTITPILTLNFIENQNFIGKKRKSPDDSNNDKYIKKVRIMAINFIITFINELIVIFSNNNIGKGWCKKQFMSINKKDLSHSSVKYDKEFLEKKLKEILSSISGKYTNVLGDKHKKLIEYLINLEDKGKYFQELFELSFLDCIEHINGTKTSELLNGLPTMEEMFKNEMKSLSKYDFNNLKECFMKYEQIVRNKMPRKSKKSQK